MTQSLKQKKKGLRKSKTTKITTTGFRLKGMVGTVLRAAMYARLEFPGSHCGFQSRFAHEPLTSGLKIRWSYKAFSGLGTF